MNPIFEKLQRSWQLFQRSVLVVRDEPKLLIFPMVTGILTAAIALFFLAPVALLLVAPHWLDATRFRGLVDHLGVLRFGRGVQMGPAGPVLLAGLYLVNMFLASMGSVAFNSEILEALSGRPVSIRHGLEVACRRWKAVLMWSLFAGLIGLIIRSLEERWALFGRIVAGLIGLAWSAASIFAIPILVREPSLSNPLAVLSKSADTIKRTWGEMLAGYVGMRGSHILVVWASLLYWISAGLTAYLLGNAWVLLLAAGPWICGLIIYSYLAGVASRVYLCALYLYAAEGAVPGPYDAEMMGMAWKLKKGAR